MNRENEKNCVSLLESRIKKLQRTLAFFNTEYEQVKDSFFHVENTFVFKCTVCREVARNI